MEEVAVESAKLRNEVKLKVTKPNEVHARKEAEARSGGEGDKRDRGEG